MSGNIQPRLRPTVSEAPHEPTDELPVREDEPEVPVEAESDAVEDGRVGGRSVVSRVLLYEVADGRRSVGSIVPTGRLVTLSSGGGTTTFGVGSGV